VLNTGRRWAAWQEVATAGRIGWRGWLGLRLWRRGQGGTGGGSGGRCGRVSCGNTRTRRRWCVPWPSSRPSACACWTPSGHRCGPRRSGTGTARADFFFFRKNHCLPSVFSVDPRQTCHERLLAVMLLFFLPSVGFSTRQSLCRVPDKKHSAKSRLPAL